jgi:hypothetical protein
MSLTLISSWKRWWSAITTTISCAARYRTTISLDKMVVVTSPEDRETRARLSVLSRRVHAYGCAAVALEAILHDSIVTFFLQFGKLDYFWRYFGFRFSSYQQLVFRGKK